MRSQVTRQEFLTPLSLDMVIATRPDLAFPQRHWLDSDIVNLLLNPEAAGAQQHFTIVGDYERREVIAEKVTQATRWKGLALTESLEPSASSNERALFRTITSYFTSLKIQRPDEAGFMQNGWSLTLTQMGREHGQAVPRILLTGSQLTPAIQRLVLYDEQARAWKEPDISGSSASPELLMAKRYTELALQLAHPAIGSIESILDIPV